MVSFFSCLSSVILCPFAILSFCWIVLYHLPCSSFLSFWNVIFICFSFGDTHSDDQGLFLVLQPEIMSDKLRKPYEMTEMEPGLATFKASVYPLYYLYGPSFLNIAFFFLISILYFHFLHCWLSPFGLDKHQHHGVIKVIIWGFTELVVSPSDVVCTH